MNIRTSRGKLGQCGMVRLRARTAKSARETSVDEENDVCPDGKASRSDSDEEFIVEGDSPSIRTDAREVNSSGDEEEILPLECQVNLKIEAAVHSTGSDFEPCAHPAECSQLNTELKSKLQLFVHVAFLFLRKSIDTSSFPPAKKHKSIRRKSNHLEPSTPPLTDLFDIRLLPVETFALSQLLVLEKEAGGKFKCFVPGCDKSFKVLPSFKYHYEHQLHSLELFFRHAFIHQQNEMNDFMLQLNAHHTTLFPKTTADLDSLILELQSAEVFQTDSLELNYLFGLDDDRIRQCSIKFTLPPMSSSKISAEPNDLVDSSISKHPNATQSVQMAAHPNASPLIRKKRSKPSVDSMPSSKIIKINDGGVRRDVVPVHFTKIQCPASSMTIISDQV